MILLFFGCFEFVRSLLLIFYDSGGYFLSGNDWDPRLIIIPDSLVQIGTVLVSCKRLQVYLNVIIIFQDPVYIRTRPAPAGRRDASTRRRVDASTRWRVDASMCQRIDASTHRHVAWTRRSGDASTRRRIDASMRPRGDASTRRRVDACRRVDALV